MAVVKMNVVRTKAIFFILIYISCSDVKDHDDCGRNDDDDGGDDDEDVDDVNGGGDDDGGDDDDDVDDVDGGGDDDDEDGCSTKSSGSNMTSGDEGTRCVAPIIISKF